VAWTWSPFDPAAEISGYIIHISFHVSRDWATLTPWSFEGVPLPYIATRSLQDPLSNRFFYIGPLAIFLVWGKGCTQNQETE
jgi:hypothetical protein